MADAADFNPFEARHSRRQEARRTLIALAILLAVGLVIYFIVQRKTSVPPPAGPHVRTPEEEKALLERLTTITSGDGNFKPNVKTINALRQQTSSRPSTTNTVPISDDRMRRLTEMTSAK